MVEMVVSTIESSPADPVGLGGLNIKTLWFRPEESGLNMCDSCAGQGGGHAEGKRTPASSVNHKANFLLPP
ncbi:uncharacterized protein QC761_0016060 [Podospora bellae-mahoneyi]|uniref:Uncharacterized protein n=1 Tax=Podospora bellae-mahoneyi TaxID=2093777 RepID=A0ABR0FZN0_9PEZI|nr:hypothetical protein QC761_0016060 [Podospora bellae-mahoneyi]